MKFVDLHIHTQFSDGWITPEDAVKRARKIGLAAIAIADHDSVSGIQHAIWASEKYGVEVIPSVELSCQIRDKELHILGYFVDWGDKWFIDELFSLQEFRKDRAKGIVKRLRELGMDISYNMVVAVAGGVIGRPHIARVMMDRGYVRTIDEAFTRYLGTGKPAYVRKYLLSPAEAIWMLKKIGGIPVLAHPVFARADDMLQELVGLGLRGIEAYHVKQNASTTKHYEQLAQKHGLLATGGSDSHGSKDAPLGCIRVPYSHVERLKELTVV